MKTARRVAVLPLAAALAGCATPAIVMVSPAYDASQVQRVALIRFPDFPGMPGSGEVVAGTFDKYLLLGSYRVIERRQVDEIVKEQRFHASGAVDPATVRKLGKLLGVDALVFGTLTDFSRPRDQTVMVDITQEQSDPIYEKVETIHKSGDTTVKTVQDVVTGYNVRTNEQMVPQTETIPAHVGLSVRLVSVQTGEVLWSASGSSDSSDLGGAAEEASSQIMEAVAKRLKPKK